MRHSFLSSRGFSLVELSIVLVILGLLTGGILSGQALIRASEWRKATNDLMRYQTSFFAFRDKYFSMPGDMTNAYKFWGTAAACNDTYISADDNGCNGNGDGLINDYNNKGEDLRAWQYLALTGLIEGTYTGIVAPSGNKRQVGLNIPRSPFNTAGYSYATATGAVWGKTGNYLSLSAETGTHMGGSFAKPEDVWNVDKKLDDGVASTGRVVGNQAGTCTVSNDYDLTNTGNVCSITYWMNN